MQALWSLAALKGGADALLTTSVPLTAALLQLIKNDEPLLRSLSARVLAHWACVAGADACAHLGAAEGLCPGLVDLLLNSLEAVQQ